jgi:hypothetical protein
MTLTPQDSQTITDAVRIVIVALCGALAGWWTARRKKK